MRIPRLVIAGALLGAAIGFARVYLRKLAEMSAPPRGPSTDDEEPVLGYDGMDVDTLLTWLADARLDDETIDRIRRYELDHLGREAVLAELEARV